MSREYLSDEELQKLISDIELGDMAEAPVHLEEKVLRAIDSSKGTGNKERIRKKKIVEYRMYRMKVALTVAAAIIVMFLVPYSPVTDKFISMREEHVSQNINSEREDASDKFYAEEFSEKKLCTIISQKREETEMRMMNMFK
ncbi:MAG: hypothetical protein J5802_05465 [Butyrivibrio sp.]|nr:hypothetical protein [Butyrivibrio sp.]